MLLSDLQFDYPEELIALEPSRPTRVMWVENEKAIELSMDQFIEKIPAGDLLVLNDTRVLKRRVFVKDFKNNETLEILFMDQLDQNKFQVLFPSKKMKIGESLLLPNGSTMTLLEKGLPQIVKVEPQITASDFEKIAELPLPPYIQKARNLRHNQIQDESWYQTKWAQTPGSFAAPTASLHFNEEHLKKLISRGVKIEKITLHVGLGTFLPVKVQDLNDHKMHAEIYEVSPSVWQNILQAKKMNQKIWALGTTVTRTLETVARTQKLKATSDLMLKPGSEFLIVDRLLTNFHQPESTLLALVAAFSTLDQVKAHYRWAIERKFKLFSYGDLSVWIK